jgi:hypothetical protein
LAGIFAIRASLQEGLIGLAIFHLKRAVRQAKLAPVNNKRQITRLGAVFVAFDRDRLRN